MTRIARAQHPSNTVLDLLERVQAAYACAPETADAAPLSLPELLLAAPDVRAVLGAPILCACADPPPPGVTVWAHWTEGDYRSRLIIQSLDPMAAADAHTFALDASHLAAAVDPLAAVAATQGLRLVFADLFPARRGSARIGTRLIAIFAPALEDAA